jgi:hypothetical protein
MACLIDSTLARSKSGWASIFSWTLLSATESSPGLAVRLGLSAAAKLFAGFLLSLSKVLRTPASDWASLPYCEIASVIGGSLSVRGAVETVLYLTGIGRNTGNLRPDFQGI